MKRVAIFPYLATMIRRLCAGHAGKAAFWHVRPSQASSPNRAALWEPSCVQATALGAKLRSALRRLSIEPVIPIPTIIIAQLAGSGTAVVT